MVRTAGVTATVLLKTGLRCAFDMTLHMVDSKKHETQTILGKLVLQTSTRVSRTPFRMRLGTRAAWGIYQGTGS